MKTFFVVAIVMVLGLIGALIYSINRFTRTYLIKRLGKDKTFLKYVFATIIVGIIFILLWIFVGFVSTAVIFYHFGVFWALLELIFLIIRLISKWDHRKCRFSIIAIICIPLTIIYMCIANYMCRNVVSTKYSIDNCIDYSIADNNVDIDSYRVGKKDSTDQIRIIQFADAHIGVTIDKNTFPKIAQEIQSENPDIILITGDLVDDRSNIEDVKEVIHLLSQIKTKYGIYYVYGNHDKSFLRNDKNNNTNIGNLLEESGIIILEDESVNIGNDYILIGRKDKSDNSRKTIDELVNENKTDKYYIVMDHQPCDYEAESNSGVNLVLSGHTHGGQMFPIRKIPLLFGLNDAVYGQKKINNTDFIVTSGISSWELPFKTGTVSEYNVIDINK